ncbi:hypothetical protein NQ318_008323, partial [Aromia moschata]
NSSTPVKVENTSNSVIHYLIYSYGKYNILPALVAVISVVIIIIIGINECRQCFNKLENEPPDYRIKKNFWVYGKNVESGYLKEVFTVLERLGYQNDPNSTDWDLLWAHDYPFRKLYSQLRNLKPHQKVNHFPGCGYITNKVDLATSGLKYIPPAFRLPGEKNKNIQIRKLEDIDLDKEGTFIQEYVNKPLLVNGHKFDIGIYTVITSVDPLRIYIYNGEALLRFCPIKYYPFDPKSLDKYIVGDDYLPTWEVPALDYYYNKLGCGMRDSLNTSLFVDLNLKMMRFDFVVDENLKIYLFEANMSPNLSSAHFPPKSALISTIGERIYKDTLAFRSTSERRMMVSDKNIATFPKQCGSNLCRSSCVSFDCQLCKPCLSPETRLYLEQAFIEHLHKGDCKRIFPPPMTQEEAFKNVDLDNYSAENQLHYRWFQGKCQLDISWC